MPDSVFARRILASLIAVVVSGCTTVPTDLGRDGVNLLVTTRGQMLDEVISIEATARLLESLTAAPLTPESAVRIALLNSPQLQVTYATLGFGAADVYEAGRIRNPIVTGAILDSDVLGERDQVTLGLVTTFTDLLTLPARKRLSRGEFAALQQSVGAEVLATAADAERHYYAYVGAQQVASMRTHIAKAGALSAELAGRYRDAGNLTPRELALARAAASALRLSALDAATRAYEARTDLAAAVGLSVGASWVAPAELRSPLESEDELDTLLALAFESRLDLAAARTRTNVLADRLGIVNWTRWLGELDVGIERERETDGARLSGPTVNWEFPIFNQHRDAVLRANAELQIGISELRAIAIDVDNSVRLAHVAVENAKARIAEYRDVMIPQRIEAVARVQEEVNFMLVGIFELIALKQDEYDAYQGYLESIRDYWLARADLSLATGAVLPSSTHIGEQRITVDEFIRPRSTGMDHSGHSSMDHSSMDMGSMEMGDATRAPDRTDHSGHAVPDKPSAIESDDAPIEVPDHAFESEPGGHMNHDDGESQ